MKKIALFLGIALIVFANTSVSADQYGCGGQYGSDCTSNNSILLDKTVGKPVSTKGGTTVEYVDNLSSSDYSFKPGENVFFQLKVKNTSNVVLNNVTVKDTLPSYLNALEGPGSYDSVNKVITIDVGSLQVNEEKIYTLKTVVVAQSAMPSDKNLVCMVNRAIATSGNTSDEDTSQLCAQKQVVNVVNVPSTGPEMNLAIMLGEGLLLTAGVYLKKRTS
jgi:uncharacterized repeat protein (TIGR01451 family)